MGKIFRDARIKMKYKELSGKKKELSGDIFLLPHFHLLYFFLPLRNSHFNYSLAYSSSIFLCICKHIWIYLCILIYVYIYLFPFSHKRQHIIYICFIFCYWIIYFNSLEKDPDAGKDWRQKEKGAAEDKIVGECQWLNRHECEQTPGYSGRQRRLGYHNPWDRRVRT